MSNLIPVQVRGTMDRAREGIQRIFNRWLTRHNRHLPENSEAPAAPDRPFMGWSGIRVNNLDDEILVIAELPGLSKDDFKVELTGNRFTIRGEKQSRREEKGRNVHIAEYRCSSFSRSIALPCDIHMDAARAEYKNGLLTVRLPKTEEAMARVVKVQVK